MKVEEYERRTTCSFVPQGFPSMPFKQSHYLGLAYKTDFPGKGLATWRRIITHDWRIMRGTYSFVSGNCSNTMYQTIGNISRVLAMVEILVPCFNPYSCKQASQSCPTESCSSGRCHAKVGGYSPMCLSIFPNHLESDHGRASPVSRKASQTR